MASKTTWWAAPSSPYSGSSIKRTSRSVAFLSFGCSLPSGRMPEALNNSSNKALELDVRKSLTPLDRRRAPVHSGP